MNNQDQIEFIIKKPLARVKFERTFTFVEITKTHLIFSFCKHIEEVYDLIKKKIDSEEIEFQEGPKSLSLELTFNLDSKSVLVSIPIPKLDGEANLNEIIEDLADEILKLKERVKLLEMKTLNSSLFKNSTIVKSEDDDLLNIWLDVKRFQLDINLLYKATVDGFDLKTFHSKCDNQGPTIIFVETIQGLKFGGYTAMPWEQTRSYKADNTAFLFSLSTKTKFLVKKREEATNVGPDGPTFGRGHDLYIADNCCSNFESYSLNRSYECGSGENTQRSFLSCSVYFCVKDYEVFSIKKDLKNLIPLIRKIYLNN